MILQPWHLLVMALATRIWACRTLSFGLAFLSSSPICWVLRFLRKWS